MESIPLTDNIYVFIDIPGMNYSEIDTKKFKENGLDLKLKLINQKEPSYARIRDSKNKI